MNLLGLHWIDALVVALYVVGVLAVGRYLARKVKGESDFFLAGRTLGKWFQFFLSFGTMTDPGQATITASAVYKQGAGGGWLALITLFLTPYYWFANVWFRRVRLTTMADLFEDRFGRRFLATLYAVVNLLVAIVSIGGGNIVALKTLQPIMVKAEAVYTVEERRSVDDYHAFVQLRKERAQAPLAPAKRDRYERLKDRYERGELKSYVSYLQPLPFYLASSLLVAVFIMLGGLKASAMVDALQALLVIVISGVLIPFGLARIGGVTGLHEKVPDYMFNLFGETAVSEFTWYSIGALLLVQFIGIIGSQGNMTVSGSAKNEFAARIGAVTGGFSKRFVTIAWCFCGLIAVALFGPNLADPDQTWGLLTRTLLPVGLIGVMIVGILGGKLAALGANSVVLSGLVVKNLYEPLFPGKSERHYMAVARATVPTVLLLGIGVAVYLNSAVALLKFMIALLVIWGAPILLMFQWRRLTEMAVRVQVIATMLFIGVVPWFVSATPGLRQWPALTVLTQERAAMVRTRAKADDVAAGRAARVGERVAKMQRMEPVSVFFEEGVAHSDPQNLSSPMEGLGRFNIEVGLIALTGFDVTRLTAAWLLTVRYLVDALLPIVMLIVISWMTKPRDPERVARFYVRLKTPVGATLAEDDQAVRESYANPTRYDHRKLFPRTNWEFTKWDRVDTVGFIGCGAFVGVILLFFKVVLSLGA